MSASTYLQTNWLNHAFGGDAMTLPTQWWLQLHSGEPTPTCGYNRWNTPGREEITVWTTASEAAAEIDDYVVFEAVTESQTVSYFSVWTESVVGSPLIYGTLSPSRFVFAGEDLQFVASGLTATVTGLTDYAANKLLGLTLNAASWTQPTAWWVQLHDGDPGASYGDHIVFGTERQPVAWSDVTETSYTHPRTGYVYHTVYKDNTAAIVWSNVQAETTATHVTVWDAETGGNCLYADALGADAVIHDGNNSVAPIGAIIAAMQEVYLPQTEIPETENFRYVIEDFNDWSEVHNSTWIGNQTPGTAHWIISPTPPSWGTASLDIGGGQSGGNALKMTSTGTDFPGFWYAVYRATAGSYVGAVGDEMYMVPRGMRCNYIELTVRFEDGFVATQAANPAGSSLFHWGTYAAGPYYVTLYSDNEESGNYHFYTMWRPRTDLAGTDWITVRFMFAVDHQRDRNVSPNKIQNPTAADGEFLTLLTRWYWSQYTPTAGLFNPEIAAPYSYWVDEIAVGYEEPPHSVTVQIEDFVNGQVLQLATAQTHTYIVTVTNNGDTAETGRVWLSQYYTAYFVLANPDGSAIPASFALAAGESRYFRLRTNSEVHPLAPYGLGSSPLTVAWCRASDDHRYSNTDSNVEGYLASPGCLDAHRAGFVLRINSSDASSVPVTAATCESGFIMVCPLNGAVSRSVKARYMNQTVPQISIVSQPAEGGTVSVDSSNVITFLATLGYTGTTSFTYTCADYYSHGDTLCRAWVTVE